MLEEAAARKSRSLSQEIEFRLEVSMSKEGERYLDFGDEKTLKLMRALATAKDFAETMTGGDVSQNLQET